MKKFILLILILKGITVIGQNNIGVYNPYKLAGWESYHKLKKADTTYWFNTYDRKIRLRCVKIDRVYHWYEDGSLYKTEGNHGRKVLHKKYQERYQSGQLKTLGKFRKGLKKSYWYNWTPEGVLISRGKWRRGRLHGKVITYNNDGGILMTEIYRKGKFKKIKNPQ